jgi:hypothetical protein
MRTRQVVSRYNADGIITEYDDEFLQFEGQLACSLVEKFGVIVSKAHGENSTGRAAGTLLSPEGVVDRACTIAEMLTARLRQKNWLSKGPTRDEWLAFKSRG